MNRTEFEALRDLPGKRILGDIRFSRTKALSPLLVAENVPIKNDHNLETRLNISYNPETGSKSLNVHVAGTGPICRLDVDGPVHRPAGRSHKHSLQTERCPSRNLPDKVIDRADLSGKPIAEVFNIFCKAVDIEHEGELEVPNEEEVVAE
jgi:hypothetical protein